MRIQKIGSSTYFKKPIVVIYNVISYNALGLSTMKNIRLVDTGLVARPGGVETVPNSFHHVTS